MPSKTPWTKGKRVCESPKLADLVMQCARHSSLKHHKGHYTFRGSSNGKTWGFGPQYQGSNPCPRASNISARVAQWQSTSMVRRMSWVRSPPRARSVSLKSKGPPQHPSLKTAIELGTRRRNARCFQPFGLFFLAACAAGSSRKAYIFPPRGSTPPRRTLKDTLACGVGGMSR